MNTSPKPLSMIYNEKSGFGSNKNQDIYQQLMQYWADQGFEIELYDLSSDRSNQILVEQVKSRHNDPNNLGVIAIAGGDGTVNSVVSHLLNSSVPILLLPLGTFNYVARVLNIPLNLMEAARLVESGISRSIHIAKINDAIYLNNASLGLYPLFIKKREIYNQKLGRIPLHAYTSGLDVLIRDRRELKLEVIVDGKCFAVKTPLLFLGNNQLQLQEMNLKIAQAAEQGRVAGVVLARTDRFTIFKTLFHLIRGKLENAADVYSFSGEHIEIRSKHKVITVAIDGEIIQLNPPLHIRTLKNALNIMVPQ